MKINKVDYKIAEVEYLGENVWGNCVYENATIQLRKSLKQDIKKQTLIHELVHAHLFEHGITQDMEKKFDYEEVCQLFSAYSENIVQLTNEYFGDKDE